MKPAPRSAGRALAVAPTAGGARHRHHGRFAALEGAARRKAVLQRAIGAAAAMAATSGGELAIVLTDDSAIRALNRDWRGMDQPTNVLSFPRCPPPPPSPAAAGAIRCSAIS